MSKRNSALVSKVKKLMQEDEDVGKISQSAPAAIAHAMEVLLERLVKGASDLALERSDKILGCGHLKAHVQAEKTLDFLRDTVEQTPDLPEKKEGSAKRARKPRAKVEKFDSDSEGEAREKKRGKGRGRGRGKEGGRGETGGRGRGRRKKEKEEETKQEENPTEGELGKENGKEGPVTEVKEEELKMEVEVKEMDGADVEGGDSKQEEVEMTDAQANAITEMLGVSKEVVEGGEENYDDDYD